MCKNRSVEGFCMAVRVSDGKVQNCPLNVVTVHTRDTSAQQFLLCKYIC